MVSSSHVSGSSPHDRHTRKIGAPGRIRTCGPSAPEADGEQSKLLVSRCLSAVPSESAIPSGSDVVEPPMAFQHPLRIAAAWSAPPAEARTPTYGCCQSHGPSHDPDLPRTQIRRRSSRAGRCRTNRRDVPAARVEPQAPKRRRLDFILNRVMEDLRRRARTSLTFSANKRHENGAARSVSRAGASNADRIGRVSLIVRTPVSAGSESLVIEGCNLE